MPAKSIPLCAEQVGDRLLQQPHELAAFTRYGFVDLNPLPSVLSKEPVARRNFQLGGHFRATLFCPGHPAVAELTRSGN